MGVTDDEVLLIGKLSRIAIDQKELAVYSAQMTRILELANLLNNSVTEQVKPMSHPLDLKARMRTDVVTETINIEDNLDAALDVKDNLYVVPQVVD